MSRQHLRNQRSVMFIALVIAVTLIGCAGNQPPQVTSTDPDQGASGVPLRPASIQVTFDQPMDKSSVEGHTSISPAVPGGTNYEWSNGDKTVAVQYGGDFAPNTTYTFTVDGQAKAANGEQMGEDYTLKFATAPPPSASQPPAGQESEKPNVVVEQHQSQQAPRQQPSGQQPSAQQPPPPPPAQQPSGQQPPKQPAGAQATPPTTGTTQNVTFTKDIAPLAKNRCNQCHSGKMSDYDQVKKLLVPGKPAQSLYYTKGIGQGGHPGGNRWKEKADLVKNWISAGAPE